MSTGLADYAGRRPAHKDGSTTRSVEPWRRARPRVVRRLTRPEKSDNRSLARRALSDRAPTRFKQGIRDSAGLEVHADVRDGHPDGSSLPPISRGGAASDA
jgi:hypothetical protein